MSSGSSRLESAGLAASAAPGARWLDGWLLRFSPGKAKRARCINPVSAGRRPLEDKLAEAAALYREAGLPMVVRITPFSQPADLDARLHALGFVRADETRVLVAKALPGAPGPLPAGLRLEPLGPADFAEAVGLLRGSEAAQRQAHAERLMRAASPGAGFVLRRDDDDRLLAAAQAVVQADLVGLYDVFTAEAARGQGLAHWLCAHALAAARARGAAIGYLQVDDGNAPASKVYARLGFVDAYRYHYRLPAGG